MKKIWALLLACVIAVGFAPAARAMDVKPGAAGGRTAVAVYHPNGSWTGSADAHQPRAALSLSKLYLGYWVLRFGHPGDRGQVEHMIRVSSDLIAEQLDRKYPHAIDAVARDFGLRNTARRGRWGNTATSAHDVAKFVSDIRRDPAAAPIIRGMRTAAPVAQDGFRQDYGTSRLPGAEGTKFGWSDDRWSYTASVSFGPGWTAAALTVGDKNANTHDALALIDPKIPSPQQPRPVGPTSSVGPYSVPLRPLREVLPPQVPYSVRVLVPPEILVPAGPPTGPGSSR